MAATAKSSLGATWRVSGRVVRAVPARNGSVRAGYESCFGFELSAGAFDVPLVEFPSLFDLLSPVGLLPDSESFFASFL